LHYKSAAPQAFAPHQAGKTTDNFRPSRRRWFNQQIGDSGEIGFGFDPSAENNGKLAAKIIMGAGMADDDSADNCRPLLLGSFQGFMGLMQFGL
jgi:hypothetical protein